jgi:hypothetical protein
MERRQTGAVGVFVHPTFGAGPGPIPPECRERVLHAFPFLERGDAKKDHLNPYMTRIQRAISPKQPWKENVKLAAGRKAISDFKKANGNIRDTLTLMIYYVKCGNDFTLEFGDIDASFYDSLCSMFSSVVQTLIKQQDQALFAEFSPLLEAELAHVDGQIGWGYPDELSNRLADLRDAFE